jgi:hypothetical protein
MAKSQKRSNKEIKKPKKEKVVAAAPATFAKSLENAGGTVKKK